MAEMKNLYNSKSMINPLRKTERHYAIVKSYKVACAATAGIAICLFVLICNIMRINDYSEIRKGKNRSEAKELFRRALSIEANRSSDYSLFNVDSIEHYWKRLLREHELDCKIAGVRILYNRFDGRTDSMLSHGMDQISQPDSLLATRVGCNNEIHVTAFMKQQTEMSDEGSLDYVVLVAISVLMMGILFICRTKLRCGNRDFNLKEYIYVTDAKIGETNNYLITEDSIYDVFSKTIQRGKITCKLTSQSGLLFHLFLRFPEHRLTQEEIFQHLWNGDGTKERVYSAIKRLRKELKDAPIQLEIVHLGNAYQLKMSNSGVSPETW